MSESPKSIREWAVATFGEVSYRRGLSRAGEELDEAVTELADVTIVLCHTFRGHWLLWPLVWLLQSRIDRKMQVNRGRTWHVRGDGTGQHIGRSGGGASSASP